MSPYLQGGDASDDRRAVFPPVRIQSHRAIYHRLSCFAHFQVYAVWSWIVSPGDILDREIGRSPCVEAREEALQREEVWHFLDEHYQPRFLLEVEFS